MKKLLVLSFILFAAISSSYASGYFYFDNANPIYQEISVNETCNYSIAAHLDWVDNSNGQVILYDLTNNTTLFSYVGHDLEVGYSSSGTLGDVAVYVAMPNGYCSVIFGWW
ncbi:hypothetical protein Palpr_2771 [Paludibacter propionicigenes WB4]|uniref:Uncharacterized protein n=1 Tax=Paludibacter propionicigenes (strain DSM 17365 / JCM 13257 / WB4) TaxID=694427 RepID=E4T856_PALPW|nr:hypothetical protein [Paludibacter propionicigenes]ADQ80900.1 hypothetical protein Palpr_2771 [Paludibacter propionicigenes WB4]